MSVPGIAPSELILGGQKSGKSRRAEMLAQSWLALSPDHEAVLIATAQPCDDEMRERIARHQRDRAKRVPQLQTVEEPLALAHEISRHSDARTMVLVDCLTLWLTNQLMPLALALAEADGPTRNPENIPKCEEKEALAQYPRASIAMLLEAIGDVAGPIVLVGNEIGLGVIPLGRQTRVFVDALGQLNQNAAGACERVTLMVAGLPLTLKGQA